MSSSFRLRRMIKEQKSSTKEVIQHRIDSPFAKYQDGELRCIVCDSVVRSEKAWPVHVNSKKHKDNIALAKELKEKVKSLPIKVDRPPAFKRPGTPPPQVVSQPVKKLKGILKNSNSKKDDDDEESEVSEKVYIDKSLVNINRNSNKIDKMEEGTQNAPSNELPDGFFDNPREDAKAHHREFKDPNDEEWERFQKEIKDAQSQSMQIINEEQEELTSERQIDEIDEQMRIWSRVLDLEKKKEQVVEKIHTEKMEVEEKDSESSDSDLNEDEIDEYLDWRAKKLH
uniref:Zinc finger protein 830 n=1 Tax=Culicoides sonorensis TaxID=179676 RepID=A0A336KS75_CULSO